MRNPWQGDGSRRGRRPDRSGSTPISSSPYDFGSQDDDKVDPVDLLAIRADDELLDALASGRGAFGAGLDARLGSDLDGLDTGFQDDQRMQELLAAWRAEVDAEPIPELVSVEEASAAIVAGHRSSRPRLRLMPVAAAAAVVVLGLSGVALGAGAARPGDALWGVSKTLNSDRASSVEAVDRVSVALASVRQALAEGRVTEAQATLANVAPELAKVTDQATKHELERKSANLTETAHEVKDGESVDTDESGKRDQAGPNHPEGRGPDGAKNGDPKSAPNQPAESGKGSERDKGGPSEGDKSGAGSQSGEQDQRRDTAPSKEKDKGKGKTSPPQKQDKQPPATGKQEPTKQDPKSDHDQKSDSNKSDSNKSDRKKGEHRGEGEGAPDGPPVTVPPGQVDEPGQHQRPPNS